MCHLHHFSIRNSDHIQITRDYSFRSTDHVEFYSVFAPPSSADRSDWPRWTCSETPAFAQPRSLVEHHSRRMCLGHVCSQEVRCSFLLFWIREELSVLAATKVMLWSPRMIHHFSASKRWSFSLFEYSLVSQHRAWWHLNHCCDVVIDVYDGDDVIDVDPSQPMSQSREETAWNHEGINVDSFRYPG